MLIDLETMTFEQFKDLIFTMPTQWLLNYFTMLHIDNESYSAIIDIIIDLEGGTTEDDQVFDTQIECFNRMVAISNVLLHRNVPVPNLRVYDA